MPKIMDSTEQQPNFQQIELTGQEESVSIFGTEVSVYSSPLSHSVNSNNIIIDNLVDYGWEQKHYIGHLVRIHLSRKYLAYSLKATMSESGFVRVIKHKTNNHLLLRGFKGGVTDLAFAHSMSRIVLGCVDEIGDLYVYEIVDKGSELTNRLNMHILRPKNTQPSIYHRINWCPYVPEDSNGLSDSAVYEDIILMSSYLVVTHDEKAEIWNVDIVTKEYGEGELQFEKIKMGLRVITDHENPITATAFSPDGIALATASLDGQVKFFKVSVQDYEEPPKCLHHWTPHFKKPLSSLFFLDNHKSYNSNVQFWKFAVTGCENNQEIKVWSCKTWSCLQTIRMLPCAADDVPPCLTADIDLSAGYIVLSDINRKVMYIMKLHYQNSVAVISSLSEFSLKFPVLSFAIFDVLPYRGKLPNSKTSMEEEEDDEEDEKDDDDEEEDEDEDSDSTKRKQNYSVKLFWIHSKSFQSCRIFYAPKIESLVHSVASVCSSQESLGFKDGLSELSADIPDPMTDEHNQTKESDMGISPNKCVSTPKMSTSATLSSPTTNILTPDYKECSDILLTPKDFSSLPSSSISNSFGNDISGIGEMNVIGPERSRRKSSQHSCASSPSREVAEILSPAEILSHGNENVSPPLDKEEMAATHDHSPPALHLERKSFISKEWPQAPDPNKEYKIISRDEGEAAPSSLVDKTPGRPTGLADGDVPDNTLMNMLLRLEKSVDSMSRQMSSVTETLQRQNQAIHFVQSEIQSLQQQQQKILQSNLQDIDALDKAMSSRLEDIVLENSASQFGRLEKLFTQRDAAEKQRQEQLLQNLVSNVTSRLEKILKQEMNPSVMSHLNKSVEMIGKNLQSELTQKLNSYDSALKESVNKQLRNKAFADNLAVSAASIMQQNFQAVCKDVFQNNVVVSIDKCCQQMFVQISEVFTDGSIEYVKKMDRQMETNKKDLDTMTKGLEHQVTRFMSDAQNALNKVVLSSQETMAKNGDALVLQIKSVVQEEVAKSLREHQSTLASARSQQSTPAPVTNPVNPEYLLQLINKGKISEAFQLALSAVNVTLVLFLCESVSPEQVFQPVPCLLPQHVLLSLIQQLNQDLGEKPDIKLRYIEDSIVSLDRNHAVTKEHAGNVLGNLKQRITAFGKSNPNHKMAMTCRKILLSIESFLK